jgi:hypothetical protein
VHSALGIGEDGLREEALFGKTIEKRGECPSTK